ncbi:MAG TPA: hypothetical protein VNP98_06045 [Chthoniobacterales bacterium]|nr:hypothetical protein [Chthoniobacterales bacterium]
MDELRVLIDTIDRALVAFDTASDDEERFQALKTATDAACLFLRKISKNLEEDVREILRSSPLGGQERGLPLTELIREHPELAPLRDFDALKKELLPSLNELAKKQGRIKQAEVQNILEQIRKLLPQITAQQTGVAQVTGKILRLQDLFCRPPKDPPPRPPKPNEPPPNRGTEVREWLNTLAEYLKMLPGAAALFMHTSAPLPPENPYEPPTVPPPIHQPAWIRLLALLALAALASYIESNGHMPPGRDPGDQEGGALRPEEKKLVEVPAEVGAHYDELVGA